VPWIRWLIAGLSQRGPAFNPKPGHVGPVVHKVAMGQVLLLLLRLFPVSIILLLRLSPVSIIPSFGPYSFLHLSLTLHNLSNRQTFNNTFKNKRICSCLICRRKQKQSSERSHFKKSQTMNKSNTDNSMFYSADTVMASCIILSGVLLHTLHIMVTACRDGRHLLIILSLWRQWTS
jgi:hypothetical protein